MIRIRRNSPSSNSKIQRGRSRTGADDLDLDLDVDVVADLDDVDVDDDVDPAELENGMTNMNFGNKDPETEGREGVDEDDGLTTSSSLEPKRRPRRNFSQKNLMARFESKVPTKSTRKQTQTSTAKVSTAPSKKESKKESRRHKKKNKKDTIFDDEMDPYDSDPGEAYRKHCMQLRGTMPKACMRMPSILKKKTNITTSTISTSSSNKRTSKTSKTNTEIESEESTSTSSTTPPSPMHSEVDDVLAQTPPSLPSSRVRYSLRTVISDGSTAQPIALSSMEQRALRPNGISLNVSHWSDKGARPYMEDRYVVEDLGSVQVEVSPVAVKTGGDIEVTYKHKNRRLKMPLSWLAVFDGHGGDKASQFSADWLSSYVRQDESFPYDLGYSMKKSYARADEDFVGTTHPDGTTACSVSLVGGRRVICANAGDSRAIVVRKDGSIVRLSRDHKPGMPDETRRITDLGGKVIYWGRWRVEGLLAVSRSIGDASLKPYVTSEPEVCEYDIGRDDWFLILASDGVWDVLENEEAAHVVIATSCVIDEEELVIDTDRFKWAARNLCEHSK